MAIQLNIANYNDLVSSIGDLFRSGQYKSVTISVFGDAEGTVFAHDNHGHPIQHRGIISASTKSEYTDIDRNLVYGTVTLNLSDGSVFVCTEVIQSNWYTLSGVSIYQR